MRETVRVGILATHPIQYQIPWFRALARSSEVDPIVLFCMVPDASQQGVGFGVPFSWDVPMFDGYPWKKLTSQNRSPTLRGFFGNRIASMESALKTERLDALILTGWNSYPLLQGLRAAQGLGIPRIVRGESNTLRRRPAWTRMLHRRLLRKYDAALAIGKLNREFYLANGVPAEKIFSTPYFVDNDRIRGQYEDARVRRAELRARWGIPESSVCFLFAGKLQSKKRPGDLVAAFESALGVDRNLSILFAGSGGLMPELQRRCRERKLPGSFAGFLNQTEVTDAYAAADCLVLPSDSGETWGLVVNEAMVCGLPVIVSDEVGCGPDLVEQGATGFVYPCGNVPELANRMAKMASDPNARREMGQNARTKIGGYSVEAAVDGTIAALKFVLRDGGSHR